MEISKESMISRQLSLESEIDKLKHECAKMYLNMVKNQDAVCMLEYDAKRDKLAALYTDLILVCHIISEIK